MIDRRVPAENQIQNPVQALVAPNAIDSNCGKSFFLLSNLSIWIKNSFPCWDSNSATFIRQINVLINSYFPMNVIVKIVMF